MTRSTQAARIIQVPNPLAAKAGGKEGEGLPADLIDNAQAMVSRLTEDYLTWVTGDLAELEGILEELPAGGPAEAGLLARAYDMLHNMKGNGATFGYDLVTAIADSACGMIRRQTAIEADRRDALRHHVAALRIVLDRKITGPGGDPGKRLMDRLHALAQPFRKA